MSRTIRRPESHLLRWWLPNLDVLTRSTDDWRQTRLPGLLYSPEEALIVRKVQSDLHRFFSGPDHLHRNRIHRKYRQRSRRNIRQHLRKGEWDDYVSPEIYHPYMW